MGYMGDIGLHGVYKLYKVPLGNLLRFTAIEVYNF